MLVLIFPGACSGCDSPVENERLVCGSCVAEIKLVREFSSCEKCGTPFVFFGGEDEEIGQKSASTGVTGHLCGKCLSGKFSFAAARSVALYEGKIRDIIHQFKYEGALGLESFLSDMMIKNFHYVPGSFDLLTPVPMHISKLRQREYNQSAVLAFNLARSAGVKCDLLTFKKIRDTRPQIEFRNEDERRRNVRGAFRLPLPNCLRTGLYF